AIDEIREVLKIDPNYYWCWSQLADWLQASALWKEYREAAEHLVRLAPNTALPLAYRGEARVRLGDRAGGKADLQAALQLAPDHLLAGFLLFDEQLADKELDAAAKTVAALERHHGGDFLLARQVQLHCARGEQEPAVDAFRRICVSDEPNPW